jgi:hypothetical protein
MSLHPTPGSGVPRETAAHAYLLWDALGPIGTDIQFAGMFARVAQPAAGPWRLAIITLLQLSERERAAPGLRAAC